MFLDLDEAASNLLNIELNKIGGEFDEELLARLLSDVESSDMELPDT